MRALLAGDRTHRRALSDIRELLPGAGVIWDAEAGRDSVFSRAGTGFGDGGAERGRAETAAGPDRVAELEAGVPGGVYAAGQRERFRQDAGGPGQELPS